MRETKPFRFSGFNLPNTMDITKWSGDVNFNNNFTSAVVKIANSHREYQVDLFENYQTVKISAAGMLLLEFTDTINNVYDLSTFTRKIKNQVYIFENGELVIKQLERKVNFLTKLDKDTTLSNKFIAMDLETRNINGNFQPYCVAFYCIDSDNLERSQSYYLSDFESPDEMLKFSLNALFNIKYDGYTVYLHNFSNFDAIFLIRILSEMLPKIRPVIRDGRIINFAVYYGSNSKNKINFRDSYLILTSSLQDLAKNFNVELQKGLFPYKFADIVDLKYKGALPSINYFDEITQDQYDKYCSERLIWNLEEETRFYCILGCKVLYSVIKTYSNFIFDLFSLDIHKYPTLPSSTLAIYRSNFLTDDCKIPLIDGVMYNDLKKAYTGGMVDVYKPTNDPNTKVFSYDVNSLYPFSMHSFAMPTGTPKLFEGEILRVNPNVSPPKYKKDKDGKLTNERIDIIQPLEAIENITDKFITFDLETYINDDRSFYLLSASLYDGKKTYSVYKGDFMDDKEMLDDIFNVLLSKNYSGRFVYIHNGAKFDMNFLVNYLLERKDIKLEPLYKDGLFLSLTIKFGKKFSNSLTIRDSYLLLPSSLSKLGKSLDVKCQKDIYPYFFTKPHKLKYEGNVPDYDYFDHKKVYLSDYNNYVYRFKNSKWNLKNETISYCEKDCVSLYQVIKKFSDLIFDKLKVSIFKAPTLASLTFMIYRTKYLKNKIIPILDRRLYDILVKSYFGGHVDCYIPESNPQFTLEQIIQFINNNETDSLETVKHYDINSLYPSVMKNYQYPTDIIGHFIGDISLINNLNNIKFGIYRVSVNCPTNIQHPILPIKQSGRCIYPVGSWEGWYNTLEISNAQKFGCTFTILEGYLFDTADLFTDFFCFK